MKPLKIQLKNIGPFRDEKIDFEKLGDMFLVCGNTGAGKTTIFDAITFALYGSLPGARKSTQKFLRSDFCSQEEDSSVSFEYMIHGKHLKVTRIVAREIVTKNGKAKQKPEETLFSEIRDGLEMPIVENKSVLDKMIVDELGLDADEFSRIVLLPQGEFADFLRQNSKARKDTLTKLFPISLYDNIIQKTKENRDALKTQYEAVVSHLTENFNGDYSEEKEEAAIKEYMQKISTLETEQAELLKEQTALTKKQTQLQSKLDKFAEAEKLRERLHQYENARASIEQKQQKLELAIKAEPAAIAAELSGRAQNALIAERQKLSEAVVKKNEAEKSLEKLNEESAEIETLKTQNESNAVLLKTLEDASQAQTQLDKLYIEENQKSLDLQNCGDEIKTHESQIAALSEKIETLEKEKGCGDISFLTEKVEEARAALQLAEKQNESAKEKSRAGAEITRLESELATLSGQTESLHEKISASRAALDEAKTKSLAQILALQLNEGEPCPVCGATHHPNPAHLIPSQLEPHIQNGDVGTASDGKNFAEEIKMLEKNISDLECSYSDSQGKISVTKNLIFQNEEKLKQLEKIPITDEAQKNYEDAKLCFEKISSAQKNVVDKMKDISDANILLEKKRKKLEPLQKKLNDLQIIIADMRAKIGNLQTQIKEAMDASEKSGIDSKSISGAVLLVRKKIAAAKTRIANYEAASEKAKSSLAAAGGSIKQLQQSVEIREKENEDASAKLHDALIAAGFATPQEAIAARLDAKICAAYKKEIDGWKNGIATVAALLESAEKELEGASENISLELEAVNIELEKVKTRYEDARIIITETVAEKTNRENKLQDWKQHESKRKNLAEKLSLAAKLFDDIYGNNPKRVSISAWVLGVYLAEITKYASKRLQRISDGRYTLLMQDESGSGNAKKGLDLEILDAYTGKKRPCNTLSGGETFMASISLALALTDVVSNRAGGVTLDSLFIDEGFGSLDEMSLEKAISILDEIRGTRCIGLISHVAELRKRIPVHLEVKKTATGSTTEVVFDEDEG